MTESAKKTPNAQKKATKKAKPRETIRELLKERLRRLAVDEPLLFLTLSEIIASNEKAEIFGGVGTPNCTLMKEGMIMVNGGSKCCVHPAIKDVWSEIELDGVGLKAKIELDEDD